MPSFPNAPCMEAVRSFSLPRYAQLPTLRLYLDQLIEAVTDTLTPLLGPGSEKWLTPTMVGNYTKQGALPRPEGKRYQCRHIAYLTFISIAKQVLSMEEIRRLIAVQMCTYEVAEAYDYFCTEFENVLRTVFLGQPLPQDTASAPTAEAGVMRAVAFSVAHKLYLVHYLNYLQEQSENG